MHAQRNKRIARAALWVVLAVWATAAVLVLMALPAHAQSTVTTNSARTGIGAGGTGSVTSVSVTTANGLGGTVATPTTTPAITLSTGVTGIVKGNGTGLSAAVSGTDYAPATATTSILKGNGSGGFSAAASGTDYAPPTATTNLLKGNGSGGFAAAVSGTDIKTINSTSLLGSGDITVSASPAGSSGRLQYNNAGAFGGAPGSSVSANGSLTLGGATVAATDPVLNITQTWPIGGAVNFQLITANITGYATGASSRFLSFSRTDSGELVWVDAFGKLRTVDLTVNSTSILQGKLYLQDAGGGEVSPPMASPPFTVKADVVVPVFTSVTGSTG